MNLYEVVKNGMRTSLRRAGIELARTKWIKRLMSLSASRRATTLRYHGIQTVLDVGANVGQYAAEIREWGFQGRIISFEPTSAAFKALSERASADAHWSVFNLAVGAEDGVAAINVSSNAGLSSSFMPMLELHKHIYPEANYVATEKVAVTTLDSALADMITPDEALMLKMDVQGFEHFVLGGATSILSQVRLIECELSFVPLYEGQLVFPQMLALLDTLGFQLVGFNNVTSNPESGHCLQIDGIFARKQ